MAPRREVRHGDRRRRPGRARDRLPPREAAGPTVRDPRRERAGRRSLANRAGTRSASTRRRATTGSRAALPGAALVLPDRRTRWPTTSRRTRALRAAGAALGRSRRHARRRRPVRRRPPVTVRSRPTTWSSRQGDEKPPSRLRARARPAASPAHPATPQPLPVRRAGVVVAAPATRGESPTRSRTHRRFPARHRQILRGRHARGRMGSVLVFAGRTSSRWTRRWAARCAARPSRRCAAAAVPAEGCRRGSSGRRRRSAWTTAARVDDGRFDVGTSLVHRVPSDFRGSTFRSRATTATRSSTAAPSPRRRGSTSWGCSSCTRSRRCSSTATGGTPSAAEHRVPSPERARRSAGARGHPTASPRGAGPTSDARSLVSSGTDR